MKNDSFAHTIFPSELRKQYMLFEKAAESLSDIMDAFSKPKEEWNS